MESLEHKDINDQIVAEEVKTECANEPIAATSAKSTFPTMIDLLAMLGLYFITQTIATLVFASMGWSASLPANFSELTIEMQRNAESVAGHTTLLWSLTALPLMLIMVMVYRSVRNGHYDKIRHSINGLNPTILLWGVIMLVSLVVVMEPLFEILPDAALPQGRGLSMLTALVIIAPIFEELLCRGVILESLRSRYGAAIACLISAIFFAVMHVELQAMANAFVMGLLLGYIYLRTNSIYAPIILHGINNLFAYMFLVFDITDLSLRELINNPTFYRVIYGSAVGIMALSLIAISRYVIILQRNDKAKKELSTK